MYLVSNRLILYLKDIDLTDYQAINEMGSFHIPAMLTGVKTAYTTLINMFVQDYLGFTNIALIRFFTLLLVLSGIICIVVWMFRERVIQKGLTMS